MSTFTQFITCLVSWLDTQYSLLASTQATAVDVILPVTCHLKLHCDTPLQLSHVHQSYLYRQTITTPEITVICQM